MAIELTCQGCQRKLRVGDEHAGKQARCPQCGSVMPVPAASSGSTREGTRGGSNDAGFGSLGGLGPAPGRSAPAGNPFAANSGSVGGSVGGSAWQREGGDRWTMVTPEGVTYGPVPRTELDRWVSEGRVSPQATLMREPDRMGVPATTVFPQLSLAAGSTFTANPFADRPTTAFAGAAQPYFTGRSHRGGPILALGIGALVCSIPGCFCFLGIPGLTLGIITLVMGAADLKVMRSGTMDPRGHGPTLAGVICASIGIAILAIYLIIIVGGRM